MQLSVAVDRLLQSIPLDRKFAIKRFDKFDSKFSTIVKSGGSFYNEFLFKNRFSNGLLFYVLLDENKSFIASLWVHPEGIRFVDEIGVTFKSQQRDIWLRDGYVRPIYRGQRLLQQLILHTVLKDYSDKDIIWSDTERSNQSSLRFHKKAGFKDEGVVCTLSLVNRLVLFRYINLPPKLCANFYNSNMRYLLKNKDFYNFWRKKLS